MHTSSSAKRTWRLWVSAVEYTATVLIPSSRQAQMMRRAISPRLAIRILRNTGRSGGHRPQPEQHLAVLDGLAVGDPDLDHLGVDLRFDLVHELHGLDDAQHLALAHARAHLHEGSGLGAGRAVERPHDGRAQVHEAGLGG